MKNYTPSYNTGIAKCVSPMVGVHDVYEARIFSTMNHPNNVGLKTEEIKPLPGEYARTRVFGTIHKDVVDTHDSRYMVDNKVLYKKGEYDFITIQKKPEDWSNWFN